MRTYNLKTFQNEDDISYYLLGAFITDGCVSVLPTKKQAILASKDEDWISLIRDFICPEMPIKHQNNCSKIVICNTKIADWLISKECVPHKSLTVKFPNIPEKYIPDFIRGCIDGDGTLGMYKNVVKCKLGSGSFIFLEKLHNILLSKNIPNNFYKRNQPLTSKIGNRTIFRSGPHYDLQLAAKSARTFLSWIYYPNHKLSMPRKSALAKIAINQYNNL
jgi:hypothetical protein